MQKYDIFSYPPNFFALFFSLMALLIEFLEITYCCKSKNYLVIPVWMASFAPLQSIFPMFR